MSRLKHILPLICILTQATYTHKVYAQGNELKKEVQVVRPYEPAISDANKINLQPKIVDTIRVNPSFNYTVVQRPVNTYFTPPPLSAARMVSEPLPDLKNSLISIGIGNTILPIAEAYLASNRNDKYQYGAWFKLHNTNAKVNLSDDLKVKAPSSNINLILFGKRIFDKQILQADLGFNRVHKSYYGYQYTNPLATFVNDKQHINNLTANIEFKTTHKDSARLNYHASARFNHLADKFNMQENMISGLFKLDRFLGMEQFGGEVSFTHYARNKSMGSVNNSIFQIRPWAHLFGEQWHAIAGLNVIYDANGNVNNTYFLPHGFLSYDIVSHYIIPYIEIDGYIQENSYATLLEANPWTVPGTTAWNSIHKMVVGGGIKGKFSPTISYHAKASYAIIDSMCFFKNISIDMTNPLNNRFGVVFDNIERTTVKGELSFDPSEKFHMNANAEFYQYKTKKIEYPWHLPDYYLSATGSYTYKGKLKTTANLFAVGKRWATDQTATPVTLNDYIDLNLGIEFMYNKRLSVYVNANNILSQQYELWYLYPTQRFNMIAGLSYKF